MTNNIKTKVNKKKNNKTERGSIMEPIEKLFNEWDEKIIINNIKKMEKESVHFTEEEKSNVIKNTFILSGMDLKEPKMSKEWYEKTFPLMGKIDNTSWIYLKMVISSGDEGNFIKHQKIFYKHKYGCNPIRISEEV